MYLSYIVEIIIGPLTGKLTNQIGTDATIVLGAVTFDFSFESLIPGRIARSSTFHCTLGITPHLYGVNSKQGSLGSDFYCCFFDQGLKFTRKNYTIRR